MTPALRILFSRRYWRTLPLAAFFGGVFATVGIVAVIREVAQKLTSIVFPGDETLRNFLSSHWVLVLSGVLVLAFSKGVHGVWPKTLVSAKIKERDLTIKIEVGDIFASKDTLIIATNCTFDTELAHGLISGRSVQGQYTKRFYKDVSHLDAEIANALDGIGHDGLSRAVKKVGKLKQYAVGTVAPVGSSVRPALFVAVPHINQHGVANATLEDLRVGLSSLWQFIAEKGGGLPCLRAPILGSGFSKIAES